jgi:hypothetical protein
VTVQPDDAPLDGFAAWQEQTAALERMAKAAGLEGRRPALPPPNPLLMATADDTPAVPLVGPTSAAAPVGDGAPGDGLREQIARWLWERSVWQHENWEPTDEAWSSYRHRDVWLTSADDLLAGPLAPTLAALDRVREQPSGMQIALAWHDVTCPEAEDCRDRQLHALSSPVATLHLPRFLDRLSALRGEQ